MRNDDTCDKSTGCGKILDPNDDKLWNSRVEKGAFFGTFYWVPLCISRQIVLESAKRRPDLIVANYTNSIGASSYHPYSKSTDPNVDSFDFEKVDLKGQKLEKKLSLVDDYIGKYKYLIVLGGISVSDRLQVFLARSGAVILLQESDILYHFSPRLKPWVHYVPLSYTAADVIEKIEWLKSHDHVARRIARNGYVFGKSYLRLEDYYCYIAQGLHAFGRVMTSNALVPYNMTEIN